MSDEELRQTTECDLFFLDSILTYCIQQMQSGLERKRDMHEMDKLEVAACSARKVQELWRKQKNPDGGSSQMQFFILFKNNLF